VGPSSVARRRSISRAPPHAFRGGPAQALAGGARGEIDTRARLRDKVGWGEAGRGPKQAPRTRQAARRAGCLHTRRLTVIDTDKAITRTDDALDPAVFTGSTTTHVFAKDEPEVRLWHNPAGDAVYAPRVTFWPDVSGGGWFAVEFSVPKMIAPSIGGRASFLAGNITQEQVDDALQRVNAFLRSTFGLDHVETWKTQRVDYAHNWTLGALLPVYMSVLQKARISGWSRHPFEASEGVVWKSKSTKGRWVKFYNKTKELDGTGEEIPDGVLRFEVSNYKDAVTYMCSAWFGGDTVLETTRFGRALYVLARQWQRLGLGESDSFGRDELLLFRLAELYGTRSVASAFYVLELHERYGVEAVDLGLVTRSTWYYQVKRLRADGFLLSVSGEDEVVQRQALAALHLPVEQVVTREQAKNVVAAAPPPGSNVVLESGENFRARANVQWVVLADLLGLVPGAPVSRYLLERVQCLGS